MPGTETTSVTQGAGNEDRRPVTDHAAAYNAGLLVTALFAAPVTFVAGATTGGAQICSLGIVAVLAIVTAVLGWFKVRNETRFKRFQRAEQEKLDDLLNAEQLRTSLLLNGAMLGTASRLRDFIAWDREKQGRELSGMRQSIVSKVCDLVQSDRPRAGYFRVEDLTATPRVMVRDASDARGRTDEFTSRFVEGSDEDANVWELIDHGDCDSQADLEKNPPQGFDTTLHPGYRSYVSAAVRAGNLPFGMLTANTVEPNGFTAPDVAVVKALARLLAVAETAAMSPARIKTITAELASRTPSDDGGTLNADEGG